MPSDEMLDGLDPVELMDREAARVEAHYAQLDADGWLRASRCAGWTVRDVLAHLTATEDYHHACLDGRVGELLQQMAERGVTSVGDFNEQGVAALRGVPDDELLRRWSAADAETRRRFGERGDGEVDTSVGPYPARWQAFHLATELATHADDVGVPIAEAEREARRDWRVRFSRFALLESKPDLVVEPVEGGTRVAGAGVDVVLGDDDLIEAVVGRGNPTRIDPTVQALLSTTP
jgi:uncharacterized protein (TIGR03083 family)